MLIDLIYILVALVCGCVLLFVSQQGLLHSIIICAALGVTFAGLLTKAIDAPTPLFVVAALVLTALLIYLGRCEHTAPNAATDQPTEATKEYKGLLHPTVTEALRQRMATNE